MSNEQERHAFARGLSRWRLARGWTQKRLAEELGIATGIVGNWESARTMPSPRSAYQIERKLGITVEGLAVHESLSQAPKLNEERLVGLRDDPLGTLPSRLRDYIDRWINAAGGDDAELGWLLKELLTRYPPPNHGSGSTVDDRATVLSANDTAEVAALHDEARMRALAAAEAEPPGDRNEAAESTPGVAQDLEQQRAGANLRRRRTA